ncbi:MULTISPECIES: Wzz/FepE/Etk N-terminal domain-containing protein [Gammaproteobacteria]|uniref:Chain length determinant protein n=1 Tax=Marinobacter litoralis TaxID=187981 RepID=A0A3M2RG40_9GAMM|nr:Wzz/FepE/Etk N-terminal domain-containing protein [Marinobacter litoralis]RMJ03925.1 Chain length determinant protein [Marinobacter litoralis]
MQPPVSTANDKVQEVSLIDLALVFIRFKKVFFLVFSVVLLIALALALILPEKYQYTTLMQLAEKASDEPMESPRAIVGWLELSLFPMIETKYRDEGSRRMPFELEVVVPTDTVLLKLASKAEREDYVDLEQIHHSVANKIMERQKAAVHRHVKRLQDQLTSVNETIELLRAMDGPGTALPDALDRKAGLEREILLVREFETVTVAQQSLEPVSKSPLFIIVIGGFLAGVLASIATLVWALFSHARKRLSVTEVA